MKFLSVLGRCPRWFLSLLAFALATVAVLMGGYRGRVVRANLRRAFPNVSALRRAMYFVQFQRHFTQLLVESAKLFTMSSLSRMHI